MKRLSLIFVLLFLSGALLASEADTFIRNGNKAYGNGLFTEAVDQYKKVITLGYESPELYYNLGNAYFKLNDYPNAILWFERARRLDPGDEDIDFNLKVANNKIADQIEPLPELFYKRWFRSLIDLFPADSWAITGIILFILALISGTLYLISRVLILRKIGFWVGSVILFFSILSILFAWTGYSNVKNANEAIIFTPTITIKSSPDEKSVDLFVLHEGTKVQIKDQIGTWYEIRISNGSVGWIPSTAIEKI
ncbi:MAG: tetratricopeptide repeat protein [bacterium]